VSSVARLGKDIGIPLTEARIATGSQRLEPPATVACVREPMHCDHALLDPPHLDLLLIGELRHQLALVALSRKVETAIGETNEPVLGTRYGADPQHPPPPAVLPNAGELERSPPKGLLKLFMAAAKARLCREAFGHNDFGRDRYIRAPYELDRREMRHRHAAILSVKNRRMYPDRHRD
jgi:hypothetical protein